MALIAQAVENYGVTGGLGLMGFLLLLILSRVKRVRIFIQVDKE